MRAAFYRAYGEARDVFEVAELPTPAPAPGEVCVRVAFSGVNPSDCNRRRGIRQRLDDPLIVPHNDGAGVIEAVGEGVDPARIGQRVWIWNGQRDGRTMGTAAECFVGPERYAVPLPDTVSLEEGACLGVPSVTAYTSVLEEGPLDGLDVLITGAAGAVGHYAAQIARLAGAGRVFGTVSDANKAAHAAHAGLDAVINYRQEDLAARVAELTGGKGVERISEVNFAANIDTIHAVAGPRCAVGIYGSAGGAEAAVSILPLIYGHVSLRFIQCNIIPPAFRAQATRDITRWAAAGQLKHTVGAVFDLADAAKAHEAVESGKVVGNVLLRI